MLATVARAIPVKSAISRAVAPGRSPTAARIASRFAPRRARPAVAAERTGAAPGAVHPAHVERLQRPLELLRFLVRGLRRLLAIADLGEDVIEKVWRHDAHSTYRALDRR